MLPMQGFASTSGAQTCPAGSGSAHPLNNVDEHGKVQGGPLDSKVVLLVVDVFELVVVVREVVTLGSNVVVDVDVLCVTVVVVGVAVLVVTVVVVWVVVLVIVLVLLVVGVVRVLVVVVVRVVVTVVVLVCVLELIIA